MTDNEFDDHFKKRLHKYEGEIPDEMWQRIIAEKEKRRGGYTWIYLAVILMLAISITGIYRFYKGTNSNDTDNTTITDTKNKTNGINKTDTAVNTNETILPDDKNITGLTVLSNKINTGKKYRRPQFVKKQITENNNYQSIEKSTGEEVNTAKRSNGESLDHAAADTTKTTAQRNPANEPITADDESTEQNEDYDKLSLQIFVSPDIPFSVIHSSNKDYEKLLNDNISMKLSYTAGASVNFAVTKRVALSTGIQYSRVNETISGNDTVAGGKYKRTNHFSFINVPFTISYKTKWTTAFQTSLKAGVLLNVSSKYEGAMPDAFGQLRDISQNVYESNTATSIYTAVNFSKQFTGNLDFFAEPYFRWQTKSMVNDHQFFTRKINTAGLALGIQWRLHKEESK